MTKIQHLVIINKYVYVYKYVSGSCNERQYEVVGR